jgi:hypothetical protein
MGLFDAFRGWFAPAQPKPEPPKWAPTFDNDVQILSGNAVIGTVTPRYAATSETAVRLCEILSDLGPKIEYRAPWLFAPGSPTYASEPVPWIVFADGQAYNAGILAKCWEPVGYNLAAGEAYCRKMMSAMR